MPPQVTTPHRSHLLSRFLTKIFYTLLTLYLTLFLFYRRIWGWHAYSTHLISTTFSAQSQDFEGMGMGSEGMSKMCRGILKEQNMWHRASEDRDWWMWMGCLGTRDGSWVRERVEEGGFGGVLEVGRGIEGLIYAIGEGFGGVVDVLGGGVNAILLPFTTFWRGIVGQSWRVSEVFDWLTGTSGHKKLYADGLDDSVFGRGFGERVFDGEVVSAPSYFWKAVMAFEEELISGIDFVFVAWIGVGLGLWFCVTHPEWVEMKRGVVRAWVGKVRDSLVEWKRKISEVLNPSVDKLSSAVNQLISLVTSTSQRLFTLIKPYLTPIWTTLSPILAYLTPIITLFLMLDSPILPDKLLILLFGSLLHNILIRLSPTNHPKSQTQTLKHISPSLFISGTLVALKLDPSIFSILTSRFMSVDSALTVQRLLRGLSILELALCPVGIALSNLAMSWAIDRRDEGVRRVKIVDSKLREWGSKVRTWIEGVFERIANFADRIWTWVLEGSGGRGWFDEERGFYNGLAEGIKGVVREVERMGDVVVMNLESAQALVKSFLMAFWDAVWAFVTYGKASEDEITGQTGETGNEGTSKIPERPKTARGETTDSQPDSSTDVPPVGEEDQLTNFWVAKVIASIWEDVVPILYSDWGWIVQLANSLVVTVSSWLTSSNTKDTAENITIDTKLNTTTPEPLQSPFPPIKEEPAAQESPYSDVFDPETENNKLSKRAPPQAWVSEISTDPKPSGTISPDDDLDVEDVLQPDFLETLGIPKSHPHHELIMSGFEGHLTQVKKVFETTLARQVAAFNIERMGWQEEREMLLRDTQGCYNQLNDKEKLLVELLEMGDEDKRWRSEVQHAAMSVIQKQRGGYPKKRNRGEKMSCQDIINLLHASSKSQHRLKSLEDQTREAIKRVLHYMPELEMEDLVERYIFESVELIRALEAVAGKRVNAPKGREVVIELRNEVENVGRERDGAMEEVRRLRGLVERKGREGGCVRKGKGGGKATGSVRLSKYRRRKKTARCFNKTTSLPSDFDAPPSRDLGLENTPTITSPKPTQNPPSSTVTYPTLHPENPSTTVQPATQATRTPFLKPPKNGYTSSIPQIRTGNGTRSVGSAESDEEM
ncbi:hypothetical protein GLAREA_01246 [Glarea lozoyensis ATCC 20868]|uniref:Uncharacterized protein n=1 Tax=Glarea lozoyensis (strain ATCC 20868 / MF5171) TaxID=1116229 RepID=S3CJE8_GLAL2|nr:uncharacterized protein GLAREA_01246 [Glarea lozoyensis ATCC 20868]EPE25334.1 hypothetical protein GLAREA_01246 [Glarea lozoyensis ATCC 20868]